MTAVQRLIRARTQRAWAQLAVLTVTAAAVIAAWIDSRPTRIVSVALIALVLVTVAKFCLVTLHAVDFQTTRLSTLEERCARTESTMDSATRASSKGHAELVVDLRSIGHRLDGLADRLDLIDARTPADQEEFGLLRREFTPTIARAMEIHGEVLALTERLERLERRLARYEPLDSDDAERQTGSS